MRVLVTGGAGFIGSHLVDRLIAAGHRVAVLDNFATGRRENLAHVAGEARVVEGDVRSEEDVRAAVRGSEVVLHQAALPSVTRSLRDPRTTHDVNALGTLNVLLAARDAGVERVVCASSSSVYGPGGGLPKSEDMPAAPVSPYAVAKLAGEGYCRSFFELHGLDTLALRYFNVFGPRQDPASRYAAVIPSFASAALAGRRPVIHGDGRQSRDFTYVTNVVEANLLAMRAPGAGGQVINVACGRRATLLELCEHLRDITGTELRPEHGPVREGDVPHSHADIELARRSLGYEPAVGLEDGLRETVAHLRGAGLEQPVRV